MLIDLLFIPGVFMKKITFLFCVSSIVVAHPDEFKKMAQKNQELYNHGIKVDADLSALAIEEYRLNMEMVAIEKERAKLKEREVAIDCKLVELSAKRELLDNQRTEHVQQSSNLYLQIMDHYLDKNKVAYKELKALFDDLCKHLGEVAVLKKDRAAVVTSINSLDLATALPEEVDTLLKKYEAINQRWQASNDAIITNNNAWLTTFVKYNIQPELNQLAITINDDFVQSMQALEKVMDEMENINAELKDTSLGLEEKENLFDARTKLNDRYLKELLKSYDNKDIWITIDLKIREALLHELQKNKQTTKK